MLVLGFLFFLAQHKRAVFGKDVINYDLSITKALAFSLLDREFREIILNENRSVVIN